MSRVSRWIETVGFIALLLAPLLFTSAAHAQAPPPPGSDRGLFERPADERLELPKLVEPGDPQPELELPPVPEPDQGAGRLSQGPVFVAREIRVTGSTVFSDAELAEVTSPYTGRLIGTEDLQRLRDELTRLYVNDGYINSGAVLPDQDASDGVVEYQVVEGRLTDIEISGNRYFHEPYLRGRLELGDDGPLNVRDLESRLRILQQDPRIRRVNAELRPGALPGEGVLGVRFEDENPWHLSADLNNFRSPDIGAEQVSLNFSNDNLLGWGDTLTVWGAKTDGLDDFELRYEVPVTVRDTVLELRWRYSSSEVVQEPFDAINIESRSHTYSVGIRHPVYRSLRNEVSLFLSGEQRESRTYLLGERLSFAPGPENGKSRVTVLRFGPNWTFRDQSQVIAVRSTFGVGLNLLDATINRGNVPDGRFLTWLGQFQWLRRFDSMWGTQLLFRGDVQLADSPLLSLEQFSVGGHRSVRGYRENQLVRDNGFAASLEARIPIFSDSLGRPILQLAPFADIGRSWNSDRPESKPKTLYSVGVGLRGSITQHLSYEIYWAEELRDVATPDDRNLQDTGVHMRVFLDFF